MKPGVDDWIEGGFKRTAETGHVNPHCAKPFPYAPDQLSLEIIVRFEIRVIKNGCEKERMKCPAGFRTL